MTKNSANENEKRRISSVDNAFDIINLLLEYGPAGATELANESHLSKGTIHIYLNTLYHNGYLLKDEGEYELSLKFLKQGGKIRGRSRLFTIGHEEVDKLAQNVNELVNLGVEERSKRVLLYKSEGEDAVTDQTPIGEHTFMHWSALGQAILAHLPERERDGIMDQGLPAATKHTITDRDDLEQKLAEIREQGYALEDEERRINMRAVAVPIIDEDEYPIGSLSISGPKSRLKRVRIEDILVEKLETTANVISLRWKHY